MLPSKTDTAKKSYIPILPICSRHVCIERMLFPARLFIKANLFTMSCRFILDTHQYFLHRLFHQNKFLYKHVHSHHHRLYVTYAFGALYNHPIEGFLLDSVGATLAFSLSGMSPRMGLLFFTFSSLKTGKPRVSKCLSCRNVA